MSCVGGGTASGVGNGNSDSSIRKLICSKKRAPSIKKLINTPVFTKIHLYNKVIANYSDEHAQTERRVHVYRNTVLCKSVVCICRGKKHEQRERIVLFYQSDKN